jgi:hypothetical protein
MTALHAAARFSVMVVHAMLDRGADPDAAHIASRTPVHELLVWEKDDESREWDTLATLELLREAGANFDLPAPCDIRRHGHDDGTRFAIYTNMTRNAHAGTHTNGQDSPENPVGAPWKTEVMTPNELGRDHPLHEIRKRFFRRHGDLSCGGLAIY